MLRSKTKAKVLCDITCNAFTVPKDTIVARDIFLKTYDIQLDDGSWMQDVEAENLASI